MAIIAVGSIAYDGIKTVRGERERVLGGSLTHFSNAASFLSRPRLVGVIGNDFLPGDRDFLSSKSSSMEGVELLEGEKCFFWKGYYSDDFNTAHTLITELNAFAKFQPKVPDSYRKGGDILFLANIDPEIQKRVADQCPQAKLKVLDTMNYWIEQHREKLDAAVRSVDGIVINEGEAALLTGEKQVLDAADSLFRLYGNLSLVIVKKGSNGVMVFGRGWQVTLPAFPVREVTDPTGAGDSFAGAFMSWLDRNRMIRLDQAAARKAVAYATVVASFAVEGFGVEGISRRTNAEVRIRYQAYRRMASF
jgi:sugar/nucleoside kinase (ribokinase family)